MKEEEFSQRLNSRERARVSSEERESRSVSSEARGDYKKEGRDAGIRGVFETSRGIQLRLPLI